MVGKKKYEDDLRDVAAREAQKPSQDSQAPEDIGDELTAPVAPAVPEPEPGEEFQTVNAQKKEKMIMDFRGQWCAGFIADALQVVVKPMGQGPLADFLASSQFITHRTQEGGKCIFVLDPGLDQDANNPEKRSPWTCPPKLDTTAAKNFIEVVEKLPATSTDVT